MQGEFRLHRPRLYILYAYIQLSNEYRVLTFGSERCSHRFRIARKQVFRPLKPSQLAKMIIQHLQGHTPILSLQKLSG